MVKRPNLYHSRYRYIRRNYYIIMTVIIIVYIHIVHIYIYIYIYLLIFHIYYIDIFNWIISISIHRRKRVSKCWITQFIDVWHILLPLSFYNNTYNTVQLCGKKKETRSETNHKSLLACSPRIINGIKMEKSIYWISPFQIHIKQF